MQRDQRRIEVRWQEKSCHPFILSPLKWGLRRRKSSSVFFRMLFRTSQFLKKYFCSLIFLAARQTVEGEQERSERRDHVVKGWEGVRWDIFTISWGCLLLLSFLFNLFFHLFSLLDLCFSISPYANKPSTSWGPNHRERWGWGRKYQRETQRRGTRRWAQEKRGRKNEVGSRDKFGVYSAADQKRFNR